MIDATTLDGQFMRQKDFMDRKAWDDVVAHIVGAGGIGSVAALSLAKVGASEFILYDDDVVERHNVANQMLSAGEGSMGIYKVADLGGIIKDFGGDHIAVTPVARRVGENFPLQIEHGKRNVVICGPNNMEARKQIWGEVKGDPAVIGWVEGRMAARAFRVYAVDPCGPEDKIVRYDETLYSTDEAENLPCSDRAVFHTNLILAGVITEMVRRFVYEVDGFKTPEPVFETMFDLASLNIMSRY